MSTLYRALRVFPLFLLLLLFPTIAVHAASEPLVIPGEPEWLGSRQISTDDGYAPLDWALDEEKEYAELYLLEEVLDDETRTSYLAESELRVYRVQAGRYRFRVAGCVRTPEGVPECGPFSKELKLTVSEQVQEALLDEEALPEEDPQQGLVGGPDDLRPGLWHDPSFGGQGWSFYWANRLALPESDPNFGNAYDFYGIWYTFEAKTVYEEDPDDCPSCPVRYRDYRPVVLTLKAVKIRSDVYGGGIYVTRDGVETQVGSANVGFGGGNTQANVTWTGVTFLTGQRLSGNFSLQLLTGSDPGDFNNVSHLGGLWNNAANDDYFVVNDIGATSETVYVIFEDDHGDPVWLLGSRSGSPVSSNTNFCLSYLNRGRRPNSAGSPSYVWHDSGCDSTQVATSSNRNSRREFIGFNQQRIWANFTLPGSSVASGSIVLGTSASPKSLQKRASFHGIDYDYAGGNSCEMTTAVPRCTVQLTWFTDGDYPNATAYMRKTGGGRTRIKTSTDPAMLNQPWTITDEGTYTFELRMGNSASSTLIAQSNTFTVTSSVVANPPPRPIALHGLWWVPEDKKYYVRWAQKASQGVSEFRLQEVRPNGSSTTYTGIAGASNAHKWFDKSSSAQGVYRYRVRACNEAGCSAWTPYMDWYTVDRSLQNIYVRDFESSAGWSRNPSGTDGALTGDQGRWNRGNPVQVSLNGVIYQLGTTVSGSTAMVTASGAGTTAWIKEVDNGAATVRSSKFTLPACTNGCLLRFHYYLAHNNTGRWEDVFRVHVVKPNGGTERLAEDRGKAQNRSAKWRQASVDLTRFAGQQIQLLFEARDGTNADAIVEAGIDDVKVVQVVNSSPVIANPGNRSHRNGDSVSFTVGVSDADDPVSSLTLGASGQPNNITFTPGTRRFSGTVNATVGSRTVTVTADDPHGGHDAKSFTWTVLNSSPVLTSPGNKSHDEGQSVSFHLSASDVDPGQSLTYSAGNLPPGLSIIGSSGRIHGTIQSGARSGNPYAVTVSANDGQGGTNSKQFTWTISGNDAPVISNPGNQSYDEGQSVTLDLSVADDPADTLSCSDGNTLPSNLSVAVHNNDKCRITGTLQENVGSYPVTITVSDGEASDSASFDINVQAGNADPDTPPAPAANPDPTPSVATSEVGATSAEFRVDEQGNATYSIPIYTVAGSGGVAPTISLNYSSGGGNGPLGVGWSIGGLSAITRCGKTLERDGEIGGVTLTSNDRYCLDGQRLVLVSGTYAQNDSVYRTEVDSFTRVTLTRDAATGKRYFVVDRKDGSTSTYGWSDDSRILSKPGNAGSALFTWAQDRFEDSAGNYMLFHYQQNTSGAVEYAIDYIEYTGNVNAGTAPFARIDFNYASAARADATHGYLAGRQLAQTKLLDSIVTRAPNQAGTMRDLYEYRLTYDDDGHGRQVLESVQQCRGTPCFGPTTFLWHKSELGISASQTTVSGLPSTIYGLQTADVTGDGLADLLYLEGGYTLRVKPGHATSSNGFATTWSTGYSVPQREGGLPPQIYAIDLNADGYQDVIYEEYRGGTDDYVWKGRISTGTALGSPITLSAPFTFNSAGDQSRAQVLDFDGDGLSDILHTQSNAEGNEQTIRVYRNTFSPGGAPFFSSGPGDIVVADDGLFPQAQGDGWRLLGTTPPYIGWHNRLTQDDMLNARVADFNGDGAADLLAYVQREYQKCISDCPDPQFTDGGSSSLDGPVYQYSYVGFWLLYESDGAGGYQPPDVIARGQDCTLSACDGSGDVYAGLPKTDHVWPADINSDGLADLVYATAGNNWYVRLNNGLTFAGDTLMSSTPPNLLHAQVRLDDWDGDGFPDLLYPSARESAGATWMVQYNDFGNGFSTPENTGVPAGHVGGTTADGDASIFADFSGDGKRDYLFIDFNSSGQIESGGIKFRRGRNLLQTESTPQPSNVITRITNGFGAKTELVYKPLTDSSVYTRMNDSSNANWGGGSVVYDLIAPMYVVGKASSSAPVYGNASAMSHVEYHYVGAKMQAGGRGFLGFGEVMSYDPQSDIQTNTRYRQDFPFVGLPADTVQVANAAWSQARHDSLSNPGLGSPVSWSGVTASTPKRGIGGGTVISYAVNEWKTKSTAGSALFPYIEDSLERSYTLAGGFDRKVLTSNSYDTYGNLTSSAVKTYATDGTSEFASQTTVNTYANNVSNWWLGRLASSTVTHKRGSDEIVRHSEFEYDAQTGILTKEIIEPGDPQLEVVTTYGLDDFGNRQTTTVKGNNMTARTSSVVYDPQGRFAVEEKNALGQTTGKVSSWGRYGNPLITEGIDGVRTYLKYDHMGRPFATYTETGQSSKTTHYATATNCPSGTVYRAVTTNGGAPDELVCYDVLGRTIRTATKDLLNTWVKVDQYYDKSGRVARASVPYSSGSPIWNQTAYDAIGRVTDVLAADGNDMTYDYDGGADNSCATPGPRTVSVTNGLSQVQTEFKNALGETTDVYDNACGQVAYDYDAVGNLIEVTGADGAVTTMAYDLAGRKIAMSDPDKGVWEYAYNALGELTRQLDSKNQAVDFNYDLLGRVIDRRERTGVTSLGGSGTVVNRETTIYGSSGNGLGQVQTVRYRTGNTGTVLHRKVYGYDSFGRQTSVSTTIGASQWTEETTYDQYSRVFQQFDASGDDNGIRFIYQNGHVHKLREARDDAAGTVYQEIEATDAWGNVTSMMLGNGVEAHATYEANSGRLDVLRAYDVDNNELQYVDYLFDVLGNLKHRHDTSGGLDHKEVFGYDNLNRLKTVNLDGAATPTLSVNYNAAGNITSKSDVGSYGYGAGNVGPHAVTSTGGGSTTYQYDANGNQISTKVGTTTTRSITYTVFDKPDSITKGANRTEFSYGIGNGRYRRVDKVGGSVDKTTTYLGSVEYIVETGGSTFYRRSLGGVALQRYYPSTGIRQHQYLLKDHLGSIHTVTNEASQIVTRMHFGPFGQRQDVDWVTPLTAFQYAPLNDITTRGFTGHEHVDDTGVIHMNGRIYDPLLGRFLQADPVVQAPKNAQNLNRYSYVVNNPLSYTDPSGYSFGSFIGRLVGKYWKVFFAAVISYGTGGAASGWAAGWGWGATGTAAFSGAVAGATISGVMTGTLDGAFRGAVAGAFAGAAFSQLGSSALGRTGKVLAHGGVGGVQNVIMGGKFGHGFVAAGMTQAFAPAINHIDADTIGFSAKRVAAAAVLGGTISELTGGKFANGAVTAAFSRAFNDESHKRSLFSNPDEDPDLLTDELLNRRLKLLRGEVARYREEIAGMSVEQFLEHVGSPGTDELFAAGAQEVLLRELNVLKAGLAVRHYLDIGDSVLEISGQLLISKGSATLMRRLGVSATPFELAPINAPSSRVMYSRTPTFRCTDVAVCGVVWK